MNNLGLEYFSGGHNATVYRLLDPFQLPGRAQDAQLVRKEQSRDTLAYAKKYAVHRLCFLLFPENFIDVKACSVQSTGPETMHFSFGMEYVPVHLMYSREAAVPCAHAHFTAALRTGYHGEKLSTCPCDTCAEHRDLHDQYRKQAFDEYYRLLDFGIGVPVTDFSDWCADDSSNIVFFEVEIIDLEKIRYYIQQNVISQNHLQAELRRLLKALSRLSKGDQFITL